MTAENIKTIVDAIHAAGIEEYTIITDDRDLTLNVDSESTRVFYDDANEMLYYIRNTNGAQPRDPRSMAIGCMNYDLVAFIVCPCKPIECINIAKAAGLEVTDDLTKWISTVGNQTGLHPIQSEPDYTKDGTPSDNIRHRPGITMG